MKKNARPGAARRDEGEFEPLYRQIALWGLSLGRPFTTPELAEAFGLTLAKAGSMLHYICGLGPDRVRVQKTYRRGGTPMKKQVLGSVEILAVAEARAAAGRYSRRRPPAAIPITLNDLWRTLSGAARKGEEDEC